MTTPQPDMPLHRAYGGALRNRVPVVTLRADGDARLLHSAAHDVAAVIDSLNDVRTAGVALHISRQVAPADLAPLLQAASRRHLAYIADPCADIVATCEAFRHARVPLVLTAHLYDRPQLVDAMTHGGFQVLLIDPLRVGGPDAARGLANLAELCGIETGIDATAHDAAQIAESAALAATLESCTRPVMLRDDAAMKATIDGHIAVDDQSIPRPSIARIRLHRVSVPMRQLYVSAMYMRRTTERAIIEIETTDGRIGYGETNGTAEVVATCTDMAHKLIGRCPLDHLTLRRACVGPMVASRNGLRDWSAWAGLEMALLDWRGRYLDQPLRKLWGDAGDAEHEVVCHIPALMLDQPIDRRDLPRLFADAERRRQVVEHTLHQQHESGFTAFKIKSTGTSPDWDVALLHDLRAALGPHVKLRWDPNANYPPAEAAALAQRLEELKLEFYEDPTRGIAGMAQVRAHVTTPLATNMCVITFDHLAHAIRRPCVDVVLADVVMWGGPQSIIDLSQLTPLLGLDLTIHSAFEVGIGTAANLHLAGALAPVRRAIDFGLENMELELITPRIPVRNGRVRAPEGPGLGVTPNWQEVARCRTHDVTTVT